MGDVVNFEDRTKKSEKDVYFTPSLDYNITINGLSYEGTFLSSWVVDNMKESKEQQYENFIRSLLNPEMFGHAVSAEVRDEARYVLGMKKVETSK